MCNFTIYYLLTEILIKTRLQHLREIRICTDPDFLQSCCHSFAVGFDLRVGGPYLF